MKKTIILLGLLAVGYANAQATGKVGVNTMNPKASLDVNVNTDNAQESATTNEGLLIPRLSKTRVANIADANLEKGTLVFVNSTTYTGANTKVSQITAEGFYYYDGTNWVAAKGTGIHVNKISGDVTITDLAGSGDAPVYVNANGTLYRGSNNTGGGYGTPVISQMIVPSGSWHCTTSNQGETWLLSTGAVLRCGMGWNNVGWPKWNFVGYELGVNNGGGTTSHQIDNNTQYYRDRVGGVGVNSYGMGEFRWGIEMGIGCQGRRIDPNAGHMQNGFCTALPAWAVRLQ